MYFYLTNLLFIYNRIIGVKNISYQTPPTYKFNINIIWKINVCFFDSFFSISFPSFYYLRIPCIYNIFRICVHSKNIHNNLLDIGFWCICIPCIFLHVKMLQAIFLISSWSLTFSPDDCQNYFYSPCSHNPYTIFQNESTSSTV